MRDNMVLNLGELQWALPLFEDADWKELEKAWETQLREMINITE